MSSWSRIFINISAGRPYRAWTPRAPLVPAAEPFVAMVQLAQSVFFERGSKSCLPKRAPSDSEKEPSQCQMALERNHETTATATR